MLTLDPALFDPTAIDPVTRSANEQIEKLLASLPPLHHQTPQEIRAARESGDGPFGPIVRHPHAETRTIAGPAGAMPVRVVRPRAEPRGVSLHLHGGGHALGSDLCPLPPGQRANERCHAFVAAALD